MTLNIADDLHTELKLRAVQERIPLYEYVESILRKALTTEVIDERLQDNCD